MSSSIARFCRGFAVALMLAVVAGPWPSVAQTALRAQPPLDRPEVAVLFAERGWPDGIELHGHFDRRVVHLPTLHALDPRRGSLRLAFDARLPGYRHASLEIRLNGRAVEAIDLLARPAGEIVVPLAAGDLARPFTAIEAVLRGSIHDDRCVDERLAGGFVTLSPASGLFIRPSPELDPDVGRTIASLPHRVEIGFAGNPADPELFRAALTTAASLARAGHIPVFRDTRPGTGGVGDGLYNLVRLEAESRPPDVLVGEPTLIRQALAAITPDRAGLVGLAEHRADVADRLIAWPMRGRTVLAVTPAAADGLATLLASGLAPVAAGLTVAVAEVSGARSSGPEVVRLAALGADLGPRTLVERAAWRLAVPVTRLPVGRVAGQAVLDLLVPPSLDPDEPGEPVLARVVVDGELAGAWRLAPANDPVRLRVPLGRSGTRLVSDIRLEVQRRPSAIACRTRPLPIELELLPSSHVELANGPDSPGNFAEFAARLGDTVELRVEPALLGQPVRLLATLTPIVEQLVRGSARLRVGTGIDGQGDDAAAILVGRRFGQTLTAPVPLTGAGVVVRSRDGAGLAEVGPGAGVAVLQLARQGAEPVLWLAGSGADLPAFRPGRVDRENVLIGDASGLRIGFDSKADRAITIDHRPAASWAERLGGAKAALAAAGWLLLTLAALVIARRRRRHRTAEVA